MKILAIADIHNDIENLMILLDKLRDFEVIVCVGDITDINLPKGFTKEDLCRIFLEELKSLNVPIFMVPGNMDKEIIPILEEEDVSVHGRGIVYKNLGIYGYGGAKTPFSTPLEPDEEEIEFGLKKGWEMVKNSEKKLQLTHAPPYMTKLDLIAEGAHVGSKSVRKFIEDYEPNFAVCGHIQEGKGIDQIKNTKIVNPGRFPEGYCSLIDIEKGEIEFLNLT